MREFLDKNLMNKYIKYLKYLLRHKYFVMLECFKVGLYWQGIIHDMSKFLLSEFIPYANFFNGDIKKGRNGTGYYKPTDTGDKAFDFAWLLHQKRNKHHWQWWIIPEDGGGVKIFDMPEKYLKEMLCDWKGAGKAQNSKSTVREWYDMNKSKMQLSQNTKDWLESNI